MKLSYGIVFHNQVKSLLTICGDDGNNLVLNLQLWRGFVEPVLP
jgi:hypothetical protein